MAQNEATLLIRIKEAGSNILESLTQKFGSFKNVALAAFAAVGAAIVKSLSDYREQEAAINSLSQSMVNAGIFTAELRDKYLQQADALQKLTTFGDEQIIKAQGILQAHLGQMEITEELTKATLDLATKTGSLEAAAQMVGKSIGTTTNALARQGVEVSANADKQERLAQVIDGLNRVVGGQAEAAAKGLGVWSQLGNAVSEISEDLGAELAPTFAVIGKALLSFTNDNLRPTAAFFSDVFGKAINGATQVLTGFGFVLESIGAQLGIVFGAVAEAAIAIASGNFKKLKDVAVSAYEQAGQVQLEITDKYGKDLANLRQSFFDNDEAQRQADLEKEKAAAAAKLELQKKAMLEAQIAKQEAMNAEQESEIAMIGANDERKLQLKIASLDKDIEAEANASNRLALLKQKSDLLEQQRILKQKAYEDKINQEKMRGYATFFDGVASLSDSSNKRIAAIGKAAAISKATIDAYLAIQNALANVPYPANIAAAAGIGVQAFANVAKISGVQLAEGGIVRATPGGIQATIGEGGRDEAVIPLDSPEAQGRLGGSTTIIFNGPVMGDENQAMEFARAIDRSLLKLRQSNQSVAFETDIF